MTEEKQSHLLIDAIAELNIETPVKDIMLKGIPTTWDKTPLKTAFEIMRFFNLKVVLAVVANALCYIPSSLFMLLINHTHLEQLLLFLFNR